jgi:hypothetical protein
LFVSYGFHSEQGSQLCIKHDIEGLSRYHSFNGNATIRSVCTVEVHITVNNITVLCVAKQYFMANLCFDMNKIYLGIHVMCTIVLSDL